MSGCCGIPVEAVQSAYQRSWRGRVAWRFSSGGHESARPIADPYRRNGRPLLNGPRSGLPSGLPVPFSIVSRLSSVASPRTCCTRSRRSSSIRARMAEKSSAARGRAMFPPIVVGRRDYSVGQERMKQRLWTRDTALRLTGLMRGCRSMSHAGAPLHAEPSWRQSNSLWSTRIAACVAGVCGPALIRARNSCQTAVGLRRDGRPSCKRTGPRGLKTEEEAAQPPRRR
jgi:hypothetical protein